MSPELANLFKRSLPLCRQAERIQSADHTVRPT
jgi:hypothetical protein